MWATQSEINSFYSSKAYVVGKRKLKTCSKHFKLNAFKAYETQH